MSAQETGQEKELILEKISRMTIAQIRRVLSRLDIADHMI